MQPYGSDRFRLAGGKVILHSAIPKGWTPRTPKSQTHSEFPGTAVVWDEATYEVLEAVPLQGGGVRYVLVPWRDDHTIRQHERYDAESEAQRLADHERAQRQRKASAVSRWNGILLGHLPNPVQVHLQNELGVSPNRMTLLSCIPPVVFLGIVVYFAVGGILGGRKSPLPLWTAPLAAFLAFESFIRFFVAMTQPRGMGSVLGSALYILYWFLAPNRARLASPFTEKGHSTTFMIPPDEETARRDALEMRGPFLTLLTPAEQQRLHETHGFDYKRHAFGVAWVILIGAALGATTSYLEVTQEGSASALISLFVALAVVVEQVLRLMTLPKRPAGSVFGVVVRPFVRNLL